ncbi:DUF1127 domain-containing protein [Amaricoccus sp.]|uniref:DUF1127 domain-containing protein n=1 Tax=Amaricoccus sp. TaxID=1872485 RepID=UPI001B74A493|nr:DUF1127 domain-containing protein [Amaricoccus sp.]MBP6999956.1 DUF1127 domain-containing protein [Amaricoccus sp.]
MSVIDLNRATPLGSVSAFRVVSIFERAIDAVVAWRQTTATARALSQLSDQQLADIGLHRGDIADVADALARR